MDRQVSTQQRRIGRFEAFPKTVIRSLNVLKLALQRRDDSDGGGPGRRRSLGFEMPEHVGARLVVHFGLEGEAVLESNRTSRCRAGRDLIVVALEVG